ncbi:MAG TPA: hypothetical protein VIA06_04170 [Candidatus Dormibacteraeota bacterium]|nr:hypothetical protein [Candidatus Dormibacteraeota bacterium]
MQRAVRGLWGAGALALAFALLPATALADSITVSLNPTTAAPGADVYVRATCSSSNSATVSSDAFATATMGPATEGGGLIALVAVNAAASPGAHPVQVTCADGQTGSSSLVVAPADGANTGDGAMAARGPNVALLALGGLLLLLGAALLLRRGGWRRA